MKFVELAEIRENTPIIPSIWKMVFHAPKIAAEAKVRHSCVVLLVSSMLIQMVTLRSSIG